MSNAINWFEANTECGGTGLEHNSDKLKNSDIPVESEFWIGQAVYSELTPWIEVFGMYVFFMHEYVKTLTGPFELKQMSGP